MVKKYFPGGKGALVAEARLGEGIFFGLFVRRGHFIRTVKNDPRNFLT
jgi:hypothetical protein